MESLDPIIAGQRTFFASGHTRDTAFRRSALIRLQEAIHKHLPPLYDALWKDLHKSEAEAYISEIALVLREIDDQIGHLRSRMRSERVCTPLFLLPSRSRIISEPLGNVLIMAPWNYPFQLTVLPLVGAIAAGNCAVLKPSPYTPTVSSVIRQMIWETFPDDYIAVVEGHRDVNEALLKEKWDYIFFTGSPELGRTVMQAAANNLTPVTLELGGKSPCIVDNSADVDIAAKRIAWGKFLNAGQTCVAPDYLLVHQNVKAPLIGRIKYWIEAFYGTDPAESQDYGRMVNDKAYDRVASYLGDGQVVIGGQTDAAERYIAPTVMDLGEMRDDVPVMQNEIFGPVLPVMEYVHLEEALEFINRHPKPLALYYFGSPKTGKTVIRNTSSGGACINDVVLHLGNDRLPFGGVGNSGMGKYHGKESFLTFSNRRSVLISPRHFDPPLKYPPYKYFKWIKRLM